MSTINGGDDGAPSVDNAQAATAARAAAADSKMTAELLAGLGELNKAEAKPAGGDIKPDAAPGEAEPKVEPVVEPAAAKLEEKPLEEVPLDAAARKRLELDQLRDRKHNDQVAKDRAAVEAAKAKLEAEWKPRVEAAERFEALVGGGVPAAMKALEALKLTPEDYAALAPAAWAMSPKGKDDPKARAAAASTLRDQSIESRFARLEKENADLKQQITAEKTAAQHKADVDSYLGTVEKALAEPTAAAPLLKRMNPAVARELFNRAALALLDETGAVPGAAEVIAAAEARERADLIARGYDPDAIVAPRGPAAKPDPKKPSPTLANAGGPATAPAAKPLTGRALDADVARGLRELRESGSV